MKKNAKHAKINVMFIILLLFVSSCSTRIGTFTLLSCRTIDKDKKYTAIAKYKSCNGFTIDRAVSKNCHIYGGEYMENVFVYRRNGLIGAIGGRYKVRGDVMGEIK